MKLKEKKVIVAAISVFNEKGIDRSKLTEVAEEAQIGIASLYRYFGNKIELVIKTAEEYSFMVSNALKENYLNEKFESLNGINKAEKILGIFKILYKEHRDYICFIEQFDNYIIKEEIDSKRLKKYEGIMLQLKDIMMVALEQGKKDGTVKQEVDGELFYITSAQMIRSLTQKLALRGMIFEGDKKNTEEEQIDLSIRMAVDFIKN